METLTQGTDNSDTRTPVPCRVHAWCVVDHDETAFGGPTNFHYSQATHTGPVNTAVEILTDGTPTIALSLGAEPEYLDAGETRALIRALLRHLLTLRALPSAPACDTCGRPVTAAQSARTWRRWALRAALTHLNPRDCANGAGR